MSTDQVLTIVGILLPLLIAQWWQWRSSNKVTVQQIVKEAVANNERDHKIKENTAAIARHVGGCEETNKRVEERLKAGDIRMKSMEEKIDKLVNKLL